MLSSDYKKLCLMSQIKLCNWKVTEMSFTCIVQALPPLGILSSSLMYTVAQVVFQNARFVQGTGPILLAGASCTGVESHLANCSNRVSSIASCSHFQDAGVACRSKWNYFSLSCQICWMTLKINFSSFEGYLVQNQTHLHTSEYMVY